MLFKVIFAFLSISSAFAADDVFQNSLEVGAPLVLPSFSTASTAFGPSLDGDAAFDHELINLSLYDGAKTLGASEHREILGAADQSAGWRLTQRLYFRGEAGVGFTWNFLNPNTTWMRVVGAGIGIRPVFGRQVIVEKKITDRASVASLWDMQKSLPSPESLLQWAPGDKLTYQSLGGIAFFGTIAHFPVSASLTLLANGTWNVRLQKIDAKNIFLKISKESIQALSGDLSGNIIGFKIEEFQDKDEGFTFLVDISSDQGRRALQDLMNGNLAGVQSQALNEVKSGAGLVQALTEFSSQAYGSANSFFFGIPIFANLTRSSAEIVSYGTEKDLQTNSILNSRTGTYRSEAKQNVVGDNRSDTKSFEFVVQNGAAPGSSIELAEASWKVAGEQMSVERINQTMVELSKNLGFYEPLQVGIPASMEPGFARLRMHILFPKPVLAKLFDLPNHLSGEDFLHAGKRIYQKLFHVPQLGQATDCLLQVICFVPRRQGETWDALQELWPLLEQAQLLTGVDKDLTHLTAAMGKQILTNAATLQTVLFFAGEGVVMDYVIEGEHMSFYHLKMKTTADSQLEIVQAPKNSQWKKGDKIPVMGLSKEFVQAVFN